MESSLRENGYSKEEEYFRRVNRQLIEKQKSNNTDEQGSDSIQIDYWQARQVDPPKREATAWWDEMLQIFSLTRRN